MTLALLIIADAVIADWVTRRSGWAMTEAARNAGTTLTDDRRAAIYDLYASRLGAWRATLAWCAS